MNQSPQLIKGLLGIGLSLSYGGQVLAWGGDGHKTVGVTLNQLLQLIVVASELDPLTERITGYRVGESRARLLVGEELAWRPSTEHFALCRHLSTLHLGRGR